MEISPSAAGKGIASGGGLRYGKRLPIYADRPLATRSAQGLV